jgi:protein-tyrosine phosphatase
MALKILMVCLGNICRSPIAHGLLQHKVEQLKLDWEIDSAGTSNWHEGELPNENSIKVMHRHGIDITYQHSRPLRRKDMEHFDIIYVMDSNNYKDVTDMAKSEQEIAKVRLIMKEVNPDINQPVPDPWGLTEQHYQDVYEMLDKATDKIIEKYKTA